MNQNTESKKKIDNCVNFCLFCGEPDGRPVYTTDTFILAFPKEVIDQYDLGENITGIVKDEEPCDKCEARMEQGVTLLESTTEPTLSENQIPLQAGDSLLYVTGKMITIYPDVAKKLLPNWKPNQKVLCVKTGTVQNILDAEARLAALADAQRGEKS